MSEGTNLPVVPDLTRQLISEVAMDIGKELVAYVEQMYPEVWGKMNGGAKLSFRNHVRNDIMSALECRTEADYQGWLERRKRQRRKLLKMTRFNRKLSPIEA